MIDRIIEKTLIERIQQVPVLALLGSRQVGKTTLAHRLKLQKPIHYLDLERPSDLAKLSDPELYLSRFSGQLVILDEVQRLPELFPVLRSLVDERRRNGEESGHFLILGSASPELLRQSSETLAGRVSYLELSPLNLLEINDATKDMERHWVNGGYPDSYLSKNSAQGEQWRDDFISSYVERYFPELGVTATSIELRRFCSMLAHQQGGLLNLSHLGKSLGIDHKTVKRYIDLLEGLFIVRRLPAWARNAGKRLVKAPKVYLRDTGILHTLAGLNSLDQLLGHPLCGHSWEGYCIEQIYQQVPKGYRMSHYRTHAGAEIDLVLESSSGETIAIEIKRTLSPKLTPAFKESMLTLKAKHGFYITPEGDSFPLSSDVQAISLIDFLKRETWS